MPRSYIHSPCRYAGVPGSHNLISCSHNHIPRHHNQLMPPRPDCETKLRRRRARRGASSGDRRDMRIVASELAWFRVPGPAARGAALLSLHDEDGREGVGEAAPIPGWSAETIELAGHALQSVRDHIGSVDDAAPPAEAVRRALALYRVLLDACPSALLFECHRHRLRCGEDS